MQLFGVSTIKKIEKYKKLLEKKLKVKINISGKKVEISGKSVDEYVAEEVLEAIDKNFSVQTALLLLNDDYIFEEIPVKDFTRKKDLTSVKARIVGRGGRTLELLSELSDCYITLSDSTVSIIGPAEKITDAMNAVKSLIQGAKTSKVYGYLERARKREQSEDLGLRTKEE